MYMPDSEKLYLMEFFMEHIHKYIKYCDDRKFILDKLYDTLDIWLEWKGSVYNSRKKANEKFLNIVSNIESKLQKAQGEEKTCLEADLQLMSSIREKYTLYMNNRADAELVDVSDMHAELNRLSSAYLKTDESTSFSGKEYILSNLPQNGVRLLLLRRKPPGIGVGEAYRAGEDKY